jgi:hypothetical protein
MNSATTALTIAIVGVFGTLSAPIVSQRLSARARREEFDQQRLHRTDEYAREQNDKVFTAKRNCYLGLFIATRRYRAELMSYLYAVNRKAVNEAAQSRLEEARFAFLASVSETQLTGNRTVLDALRPIRAGNTKGYAAIKGLEEGHPEPDGSFEEIRAFLYELWDKGWPQVVEAVRADLGVVD